MHTAAALERVHEHNGEHGANGHDTPQAEMEQKPQTGFSVATIVISVLTLIIGVMGGLLTSVATQSEWKGKTDQRLQQLEDQHKKDEAVWEYIRTQNEVNGKVLARIEAAIEAHRGKEK